MNKNNIKFLVEYTLVSTVICLPIMIAILAFLIVVNFITGGALSEVY